MIQFSMSKALIMTVVAAMVSSSHVDSFSLQKNRQLASSIFKPTQRFQDKQSYQMSYSVCCLCGKKDIEEAEKVLKEAEDALQSTSLDLESSAKEKFAKQLTEYMAKAHTHKLEAVAAAEKGLKERINELEMEVDNLKHIIQTLETRGETPKMSSDGSFVMPATNKELALKVEAYQKFISEYLVNSLIDKQKSVEAAEKKIAAMYEEKA